MNADEITAMRTWVADTAARLSTLMRMPSRAEIDALSDERIVELVEQHYTGGVRLFRWSHRNGYSD